MSRASEWAERVRDAESTVSDAQRERPEPFVLVLSLSAKFYFAVDKDGRPRLTTPEARNGYAPEVKDLLALADWITATFGEDKA